MKSKMLSTLIDVDPEDLAGTLCAINVVNLDFFLQALHHDLEVDKYET